MSRRLLQKYLYILIKFSLSQYFSILFTFSVFVMISSLSLLIFTSLSIGWLNIGCYWACRLLRYPHLTSSTTTCCCFTRLTCPWLSRRLGRSNGRTLGWLTYSNKRLGSYIYLLSVVSNNPLLIILRIRSCSRSFCTSLNCSAKHCGPWHTRCWVGQVSVSGGWICAIHWSEFKLVYKNLNLY